MLDDTTKLMLGPLLALIPILIWELAIKPSRTKRNLALLLMAEVELNLEEIAYVLAARADDPNSYVPHMLLPRGSFASSQGSLGELPPPDVRALIRFYSITGKVEAAHLGLAATIARQERASTDAERVAADQAITSGLAGLGALLMDAWAMGVDVRESLDDLIRAGWMDAPPPARDVEAIRAEARGRLVARRAGR